MRSYRRSMTFNGSNFRVELSTISHYFVPESSIVQDAFRDDSQIDSLVQKQQNKSFLHCHGWREISGRRNVTVASFGIGKVKAEYINDGIQTGLGDLFEGKS